MILLILADTQLDLKFRNIMNDDHARYNKVCYIIFDDTSHLNQTAIAQLSWACMLPYLAAYELCGGVGGRAMNVTVHLFIPPPHTHTPAPSRNLFIA